MKKTMFFIYRTVTVTLVALLGVTGFAFAEETAQPEETQEVEAEAPVAEPEIRSFGTESEDAVKFELTNKTGKDISFFNIRVDDGIDVEKKRIMALQEVLIEQGYLDDVVDGSYGPKTKAAVKAYRKANGLSEEEIVDDKMILMLFPNYDDGNILEDGDVIKADETVVIWFVEEQNEAITEEKVEAESVQEFDVYTSYVATFKLAEDETEYTLNTLPLSGKPMWVELADDVAYIEYLSVDFGTLVSTYETEYAIKHPPVAANYNGYNYYDNNYYDGYYYYQEPVYYEPVYENPPQGSDACFDITDPNNVF